jgi:hypothetical protein
VVLAELGDECVEALGMAGAERDVSTFLHEQAGTGGTDAGTRPRDGDDGSGEGSSLGRHSGTLSPVAAEPLSPP